MKRIITVLVGGGRLSSGSKYGSTNIPQPCVITKL